MQYAKEAGAEADGTPTGIPVQISKNWHAQPKKGVLRHQGPWFHGCTFVRLPPRSQREFTFSIAYARYGGVPAASHAQLSLIGWGHNQFWEQAAIGSFGESICYEPGRVQRRCCIDDIRPLMTLPSPDAKPYGWAGNCGGGDFLMWIDDAGRYQGFRATRCDYHAYGPCLTDVSYVEETSGGEVVSRVRVSIGRSDDYLRAFHHLRYDVRQPMKWQRLAFYQLGADYYNDTPARSVAIGNVNGLGQIAAEATLDDLKYYRANFKKIVATRDWLSRALTALGFAVLPSRTNFILVRPPAFPAKEWLQKLRGKKILVRWFSAPEVKDYLRITIGTPEEASALVKAVREISK